VKEAQADLCTRTAFENFSIDFQLAPRPSSITAPNNDVDKLTSSFANFMPSSVKAAFNVSSPSGGMMPLLTLKGFIDITAIEVLEDPSKGYLDLNSAMRAYDLQFWSERGDIPRSCLPDFSPPNVQARIKRVHAEAARKGQVSVLGANHWKYTIVVIGDQYANGRSKI
jgi:hypothetical protein